MNTRNWPIEHGLVLNESGKPQDEQVSNLVQKWGTGLGITVRWLPFVMLSVTTLSLAALVEDATAHAFVWFWLCMSFGCVARSSFCWHVCLRTFWWLVSLGAFG